MKKLFNLFMLLTAMMLSATTKKASAQCTAFIPAQVNETVTGTSLPSYVTWSGNDSRSSLNGMGSMRVNVWEGSSTGGLGWDDNGGNASFLTYQNTFTDPDVVLVEGLEGLCSNVAFPTNVTWYAIVVYADGSNNCTCDIYEWDLAGKTFATWLPSNTQLSSGGYTTTINVDADVNGNFAIIWDDSNSGDIQVIAGSSSSGSQPAFCVTPVSLPNTSGCLMPDISIFPGNIVVYYTYVNSSGGRIYVGMDHHALICSGTPANSNVFTASPGGTFDYPRIACPPNANYAVQDDWSIVADYMTIISSVVHHDIINYTVYKHACGFCVYNNIYTNGSVPGLCDISRAGNRFPVVSYDSNDDGIMVGWICEYDRVDANNSNPAYFNEIAPVAVACDQRGAPNSSCYHGGMGYMIVPYDNLTYNPVRQEWGLSISGRDYSSMMYTFFDDRNSDIYYKDVTFCNTNYSLRQLKNSETGAATVYPNPFANELNLSLPDSPDDNYTLRMEDVTGNVLLNAKGTKSFLNNSLNNIAMKLATGVYLLNLQSENTDVIRNKKLIKM